MNHLVAAARRTIITYDRASLDAYSAQHLTHLLSAAKAVVAEIAMTRDGYLRAKWMELGTRGNHAWASDPAYCGLSDVWRDALDEEWKVQAALVQACLREWPAI